MGPGFDLVERLNARARHAGTAAGVEQFDNLATHAQYRIPYAIAARHVSPGDAVLDWGCGNGHFSMLLEELGARVSGYSFEPAPRCMAGSAAFTHVRGDEREPRRIPFPDASFDSVFSVGVLEHVWETGGDEHASLVEIARILRPGGAFLTFHFPNRLGWVEPAFRALGISWHFHRRRYDRGEIERLWAGAGFRIESVGTYNFFPRNKIKVLPAGVRRSRLFARLYEVADLVAGAMLPPFRTNYFVVARKPS